MSSGTAKTHGFDQDAEGGERRWLGIDFSGDENKWSARCSRSNVWIATVRENSGGLRLSDVKPVQALDGAGGPFGRLASFLAKQNFAAAGIDAPFSIPAEFIPAAGYKTLLSLVGTLPTGKRPFPLAQTFADKVTSGRSMATKKPLRKTEMTWQRKGLNVRSTLWTGPRGGAAMTAACLYLLDKAACPIWPWAEGNGGLLVEAFPAAQLKTWDLPFERYNGDDGESANNRSEILSALREHLSLNSFEGTLLASADALDSVLCAFAARAVSNSKLAISPDTLDDEGFIAVHARFSADV